MGGSSRSSTGCATCRKRKIKCDEARPGCRRCAQLRRVCPGYPFQIELDIRYPPQDGPPSALLRDESTTKSESDRTWPSDKSVSTISVATPSTPASVHATTELDEVAIKFEDKEALELILQTPKRIERPESPPKYDIQHQSICFFVHLWCIQGSKLYSFPVLDFVPNVLQDASPTSPVNLAANAVSRMTLADQYSGKDLRLQTGDAYSLALTSTMECIRDPKIATADSTVVAVWLLGLYEAINSVLSHGRHSATAQGARTAEEEWQSHISHIRGALHLLKLRGDAQFTNARSEKIFRIFKAAIQLRLFTLNSVTSRNFGELDIDLYRDEHEFVPSKTADKASKFFTKVARFNERVNRHLVFSDRRTPPEDIEAETKRLIELGEHMDGSMLNWAISEAEPFWNMMPVTAEKKGTTWALYPDHALYYFFSCWVYLYWIRYLIARFKLYEALTELRKSSELKEDAGSDSPAESEQIEEYREIMQRTASKIIGLTAYTLGDVANNGTFVSAPGSTKPVLQEMNAIAAMQLVIPLKSLLRSEYVTNQQKGAIDLAINHIGDGFRRQPGEWTGS